jgi:uncharacterized C2H2 Zn-finger protein
MIFFSCFYRKRSFREHLEKSEWWKEEERQRLESKRLKEQEVVTNQVSVASWGMNE